MAKRFSELSSEHIQFIACQQMFFVATAAKDGRVNLSPKGLDTLKVINNNQIIWFNVTGSGNETAAHLLDNSRMTIMFCAFEGKPLILRLYGEARAYYERDVVWKNYASQFVLPSGVRQIFVLDVDLVQASCGMAVPLFEYKDQREGLVDWAKTKGEEGIKQYWQEKNQWSLDQKPTGIFE